MRPRRLTFRERAAIAFATAPFGEPDVLSDKEAVEAAGSLASEACEQWGHDWHKGEWREGLEPPDREVPDDVWICGRCGLVKK